MYVFKIICQTKRQVIVYGHEAQAKHKHCQKSIEYTHIMFGGIPPLLHIHNFHFKDSSELHLEQLLIQLVGNELRVGHL